MAIARPAMRRLILTCVFIVSAVAMPTAGGYFAPESQRTLAQCVSGEEQDVFTTTCTPYLVPNIQQGFTTTAANPDIPEIDGIPCTGRDSGACIGLAENAAAAGPPAVPRSTISSSP